VSHSVVLNFIRNVISTYLFHIISQFHPLVLFSTIFYTACCFMSPIMCVCVSSFSFDVQDCRFSEHIWRFMYTDLRVSLSVCFRLTKPTRCTICPQFISSINLCMFRTYLYHIIRRYTIYILHWYGLRFSVDCWPSNRQSAEKHNNITNNLVT